MQRYKNRQQAGEILAKALSPLADDKNTIILALPRGGVPVAAVIADTLHLPLDILLVRKLGSPGNPEFALGALGPDKTPYWNPYAESMANQAQRENIVARESREIERRNTHYRQGKPALDLQDKTIILVDDGIATGATLKAALQSLRHYKTKKVIVAVPVAPAECIAEISQLCDSLICPLQPEMFQAVGIWYEEFGQTSDEEVLSYLSRYLQA